MLLKRLLNDVLDFCFPGFCAGCRKPCAGNQPLCDPCAEELRELAAAPACQLCGMPLAMHGAPCVHCQQAGVAHFDRVLRLGVYDDLLRNLIHQFKYHHRWTLGEQFADWLLEQERVKTLLTETECLVPVPLHPSRQIARGYNQAEVIARRLGRRCRIPVTHPARRVRPTETQTHLHSRAQRVKNLDGAFALSKRQNIRGKHVVVIDDVMTTGTTLQVLARTLRSAKPASLCAIVVAVADPKGRGFEVV